MFVYTGVKSYSSFEVVETIYNAVGFTNAALFWIVVGVGVFFLLMSQLVTFVFTDEDRIRKGLLFPKIAYYNEIDSIKADNRYLIIKYSHNVLKISTHGFEDNKEVFSDILKEILKGSKIDKSHEQIMEEVKQKQNEEYKGEPMKIGGWILAILAYFFLSVVFIFSMFSLGIRYSFYNFSSINFVYIIFIIIMHTIQLIIVFNILSREKKTVKRLVILMWIDFVLKCLFLFTSGFILLVTSEYTDIVDYFHFAIAAGAHVMFILSTLRYFKVSKRVKMTFIK